MIRNNPGVNYYVSNCHCHSPFDFNARLIDRFLGDVHVENLHLQAATLIFFIVQICMGFDFNKYLNELLNIKLLQYCSQK